jgi:diketogulonate reductase-like aldo/keto reductase
MHPFKSVLFNTGRSIPQIGYGTYQLRGADCVKGVEIAIKCGYRHIDTASVYKNEKEIREALEKLYAEKLIKREDIFITSKIGPAQQGFENALKACDEILNNLGTNYLDLLISHWPGASNNKPEDKLNADIRLETWRALEKLQSEGKVRDIGVSNFLKRHLVHLLENSKTVPALNQFEIHPLCYDKETIDFCFQNKIVVEAYSPLARASDAFFKNERVLKIAEERKKTAAQVALRWSIQQGFVTLPKSKTEKYIVENFSIFDFELNEAEMEILTKLNENFHTCWNPESVQF